MKATVDNLEGLARKITVEIPEEKVNDAFTKVYRGIQKNATIKGFRKGKAPLDTVKKLYSDRVRGDVLQDLVSESYESALQENSLIPLGQPKFDFQELDENKDFSFTAEFEIRPEVKLNKYEGLVVEKEKIEVGDEQVEQSLTNILQSRAESVDVTEERAAQNGDIAIIDFDGTIDGEPLEGGKGSNHPLELGSNSFIPGFEEGVVGMKVRETKDLKLSFPEDYHAKDIAGKEVVFKVTVQKIQEKKLPELNDSFAQSLGEYENVDALKEAIKTEMAQSEEYRIKEDLKNRILHALVKENPVEVPKSLHQQQKAALMEDVHKKMHQQGMSPQDFEAYKEKWNEDFDKTASFMIQSNFLISELTSELKMTPTHQDIENKLNEHSSQTGLAVEQIREFYQKEGRLANLSYQVAEEKVVDFLIEKAQVNEVDKDKLEQIG